MKQPSTSLLTQSGIRFDYLNPTMESIDINDIVVSLSRMSRFLGHTKRKYTVGEHSYHCLVMAQKLGLTPREQLLVLIHDFTEAYVGDCPSPLKKLIPDFNIIEEKVELAICKKIGVEPPTADEYLTIKRIDMTMLTIEMKQLTFHNWEKFYNADIHRNLVGDEDFDLTDEINERMVQDLLKSLFIDCLNRIAEGIEGAYVHVL